MNRYFLALAAAILALSMAAARAQIIELRTSR